MQNLRLLLVPSTPDPSSSSSSSTYPTVTPSLPFSSRDQPTVFFGDVAGAPSWVLNPSNPSSHPPPSSPPPPPSTQCVSDSSLTPVLTAARTPIATKPSRKRGEGEENGKEKAVSPKAKRRRDIVEQVLCVPNQSGTERSGRATENQGGDTVAVSSESRETSASVQSSQRGMPPLSALPGGGEMPPLSALPGGVDFLAEFAALNSREQALVGWTRLPLPSLSPSLLHFSLSPSLPLSSAIWTSSCARSIIRGAWKER